MKWWVLLVLLYGLIKGLREAVKKKALEKSSVVEVLFFYTLFGFIFVLPTCSNVFALPPLYIGVIFLKSFVIFLAWICSFKAIKNIPISLYGVVDMSRVLFATALGVFVLHETMTVYQIIGLLLVLCGLLLVNRRRNAAGEEVHTKYIVLTFASCLLNAVSGVMDKVLMKGMESGQLQFWYMLFMVLLYLGYLLLSRTKVDFRALKTNYWIPLLSLLFIIADRALFIANAYPDSKVTVMTLIKQSSVLVTITLGKFVFKEKNTAYRFVCALVVIAGITIAVL